jgi:acetyl-CoA carboxylase biotin carboxylase subunit
MRRALDEFELEGLASTLEFGRWVMDQPAFVEGQFDTGFIAQYFRGAESLDSTVEPSDWLALSAMILQKQPVNTPTNLPSEPDLAWDRLWNHRTH